MSLLNVIRELLREQGELAFVDFMQLALYHPEMGYYTAGSQKFGVQGDFITAPELTPLFAKTLANQCQQVLLSLTEPNLFEFGAGSGRLCVDLLRALEARTCLPQKYFIFEISANLRQRQQALVAQEIPHLLARIHWLEDWPEQAFEAVVLANEVLDAMPVHRFLQTKEGLLESFISLDDQGNLIEQFKPSPNQALIKQVQQSLDAEFAPYLSEVNLFIDEWMQHCFSILAAGAMFIIDYGFPRGEYYHPDRNQGTLMCHYRHQAHGNPLAFPGEQDITAHVDFTQVAEAAHNAGFEVAGYCNQASFLLANGLLSLVENSNPTELFQQQQALKQLLQPSEMGELFKVIALTKNSALRLKGFELQDKRASL